MGNGSLSDWKRDFAIVRKDLSCGIYIADFRFLSRLINTTSHHPTLVMIIAGHSRKWSRLSLLNSSYPGPRSIYRSNSQL